MTSATALIGTQLTARVASVVSKQLLPIQFLPSSRNSESLPPGAGKFGQGTTELAELFVLQQVATGQPPFRRRVMSRGRQRAYAIVKDRAASPCATSS